MLGKESFSRSKSEGRGGDIHHIDAIDLSDLDEKKFAEEVDRLFAQEGQPEVEIVGEPTKEGVYMNSAEKTIENVISRLKDYAEREILAGLSQDQRTSVEKILRPFFFKYRNSSSEIWKMRLVNLLKSNKLDDKALREYEKYVSDIEENAKKEMDAAAAEYFTNNNSLH